MRRMILALAVLALLGAGYGLSVWRNAPPSADDLIAAMRQADPSLKQAEISLLACRLVIRRNGQAQGVNAIQRSEIDVDLSLFDTSTARIKAPEEGPVVLLLSRRPVSAAMLNQAEVILRALSEVGMIDASATDAASMRDGLAGMLRHRPDILSFRAEAEPGALVDPDGPTELAPIELAPAKNAPAFFDFTEAVRSTPEPRSYVAVLTFASAIQSRETLLGGLLIFPTSLQFRAPDTETARALGETIFRYTAARCPMRPAEAG